MTSSSRQAGPSPRSGETSTQDLFPERHHDETAAHGAESQYLDNSISSPQDSGASHGYPSFFDRCFGNANDFSQYQQAQSNFQSEGSVLRNRQPSESASPFAQQNDDGFLRGIEESAGAMSPRIQGNELVRRQVPPPHEAPSPYTMPRRSESLASESPAILPMQLYLEPLADQAAAQNEDSLARQTKYAACPSHLESSAAAREYRKAMTQFGRVPYRDPDSDPTIQDIENNRRIHVERIYNAMISGKIYRDNAGSIAVKRWTLDPAYPPELVEAYAHRVLDCVLSQAKHGYRGWRHNDYVADERKGDETDREVDCAGRLDNVIHSLELEKTICEDVLNSACQTRTFVNAPVAYAHRKHQNRLGNAKRGKPKGLDGNPAKKPRTRGKRETRDRSNTASDMPSSRGNTPQYQQQQIAASTPQDQQPQLQGAAPSPYFSTPNFPNLLPSPVTPGWPAAQTMPLHRSNMPSATAHNSFRPQSLTLMSPPLATSRQLPHGQQSQIARTATMQPHHQSPVMASPAQLPRSLYYAQATADEAKPVTAGSNFGNWQSTASFGGLPSTYQPFEPAVDPRLEQLDFGTTNREAGSSSFAEPAGGFVCPADLELGQSLNGNAPWDSEEHSGWNAP